MPLDFMAAKNQKAIDEKTLVFCLSESAHSTLLSASKPKKNFPKIHKFSNYYADASILFGEIKYLIEEIKAVKKASKINSSELKGLVDFLDSSYKGKFSIFIYCD